MRRASLLVVFLLMLPALAVGDAGVLLPRDKGQPNSAVLSLDEMDINVTIDNGDARVYIRQIFTNHTNRIEEGTYIFALPSRATVSDFAVWDGPTRIPATILERKRVGEIYNELKQQAIDPGLLQMGERGAEEARRSPIFTARIVPIPAYGTKRLEIEYHEAIPVENLKSSFAIPLHPDAYQAQSARVLRITFELRSAHDLAGFQLVGTSYPLKIVEKSAHSIMGEFEARNVQLAEDFAVRYDLDSRAADKLNLIAYSNPSPGEPNLTETAPARNGSEPGFFEAQALIGASTSRITKQSAPRNIIVLFDTSLSMQWEKLERSYAAMEQLLRTLRPGDRFNLLLFNNKVTAFQPQPVAATRVSVQASLDFVRASKLRGGTNLQGALQAALSQCAELQGENYLLLLSDGGATRGAISTGRLAKWYSSRWVQLAPGTRPRTYIFAAGDDANLPLLRMLARHEGVIENVLSTEPLEFKLNAFLSKIGRSPVEQLRLEAVPQQSVDLVYPLQDAAFAGSIASWVGQYRAPASATDFTVSGTRDGAPLQLRTSAKLPAQSLEHPQLPRLWARVRVDALLEKIERDGEDAKTIDEIIALARKYKFVTPYTSFLAVPRALLRPRVIRPGDPILRVRTDESIKSVVAIFPFGLTKRLRYLETEDIWQTRFVAPDDMQDGTYTVRLVLRDRVGHVYRESKTFVIASKPPVVNVRLDRASFHRGERIPLKVSASASTRTLTARLEGATPVSLRWDQKAGANTGELLVPSDLPAGSYRLTVIAEDIAHNIGTQEVRVEVLP